ncbi:hypothetical protein WH52_03210 [Tenacibaculum holothuriorum]|uniref:Cytochrome oxidase complex assembly protein 1 n=1 Tax=Tenacibaculum holothuriorum TaxID=1635173 RepID=A0A1Y2PG96_9FLAO|nr:cytochrome c oxidase assembly factor Coa1 family protein [Tenacibaculum holothuriorum]OSY88698.1 hypothetical protein WH52_03210 [Tenacibaculum holothuriorum]
MSEEQHESWFKRNWMWAVPVGGCGCGCLVIILLFVFGIGAAFFGVTSLMENSEPVEYALSKAKENSKVIELLGENLETYGIPSGNISLSNDNGEVDFSIPIRGDKGEGTLVVRGLKSNGEWAYEDLYVRVKETQEEINLLENEKVLESI